MLPALLLTSQPQPARRTFGSLAQSLDSLPSLPACASNSCHQSANGLRTEPSYAYFDWIQPSTPTLLPAEVNKLCVLGLLPLVGLFASCFPRYRQLDDNQLPPRLRLEDDVWSKCGVDDVWEHKSLPEVNFHVPPGSAA